MAEIADAELAALKEKAAASESEAKAKEDYKKDMLRFKDEAATKDAELNRLKGEKSEAEKAALLEQNRFKELYEKSEKEKADETKRADEAISTVDRYIKQGALTTAALAAGIKKEALADLKLLGFEKLTVAKEGNEVKVKGIDEFIAEQKKLRAHWFGEETPPPFNGGGGEGGQKKEDGILSAVEVEKLRKEDPKKYREYMTKLMADKKAKK